MTPLYRWDGTYVGFRSGDHLYTAEGVCFAWVDEQEHVWRREGEYLGDLHDENYVLRPSAVAEGARRTRRRMHPARPMHPIRLPNRNARAPVKGLVDALEGVASAPA